MTCNVLFLCTGNSARSILGEAILNQIGGERFRGFSAGSFPKGTVHPGAIRLLTRLGYPTEDLRSKSWDEFASPDAPEMHVILTVCDNAAGEACRIWPGHPATAHWGMPDPAVVEGDNAAVDAAFAQVHHDLTQRLRLLVNLHPGSLDRLALKTKLAEIHDRADA